MEPKYIFEGFKMVGMRDHTGQWWKVAQDCTQCGQCCMDQTPHWHFAQDDMVGGCKYLAEEDDGSKYRCLLGAYRPFGCCGNSPFSDLDYCSVKLEKIDDPSNLL
jgi:hypothetical protein